MRQYNIVKQERCSKLSKQGRPPKKHDKNLTLLVGYLNSDMIFKCLEKRRDQSLIRQVLEEIELWFLNVEIPMRCMELVSQERSSRYKKEAYQKLFKRPYFNSVNERLDSLISANENLLRVKKLNREGYADLKMSSVYDTTNDTFQYMFKYFVAKETLENSKSRNIRLHQERHQVASIRKLLRQIPHDFEQRLYDYDFLYKIVTKRIYFMERKFRNVESLRDLLAIDTFKLLNTIIEMRMEFKKASKNYSQHDDTNSNTPTGSVVNFEFESGDFDNSAANMPVTSSYISSPNESPINDPMFGNNIFHLDWGSSLHTESGELLNDQNNH
jgi:hypothetical protein